MNTEEILKFKKLLDEGVITQEEFEKEKEQFLRAYKKKSVGLIVGILVTFIFCISIIIANFNDDSVPSQEDIPAEQVVVSSVPDEFSAEFPISISGKLYDNIIGVPELSLSITNDTNKDISAIKIYFSPKDVYGEEVNGIFATEELYTDNTILAGETVTKTWQLLDSAIKAGDVYVYSVYFSDGTEWGDKDAPVSDIKKYGNKLYVKY